MSKNYKQNQNKTNKQTKRGLPFSLNSAFQTATKYCQFIKNNCVLIKPNYYISVLYSKIFYYCCLQLLSVNNMTIKLNKNKIQSCGIPDFSLNSALKALNSTLNPSLCTSQIRHLGPISARFYYVIWDSNRNSVLSLLSFSLLVVVQ